MVRSFDLYPGYLSQMKKNYKKITDNDLRILVLQKLDLNNSSMSELLCVSTEAIKKAKQRLKKIMGAQDQESISVDRTISPWLP